MAGRPIPDATNRSSHMLPPDFAMDIPIGLEILSANCPEDGGAEIASAPFNP